MTAIRDPETGRYRRQTETDTPAEPASRPATKPAKTEAQAQPAPAAGPATTGAPAGAAATAPKPAAPAAPAGPKAQPSGPLGSLLPRVVAESPVKPEPAKATEAAGKPAGQAPGSSSRRLVRMAVGAGLALAALGAVRLASRALRSWQGRGMQTAQPAAQPSAQPAPQQIAAAPDVLDPATLAAMKELGIDPSRSTL
ncbi:MAG TPA: hypothetical protein VKA64_02915 [Gammaproteobacteria bacterium]|nr:hypothetical protein [Gammaproteobacteria bacterium]